MSADNVLDVDALGMGVNGRAVGPIAVVLKDGKPLLPPLPDVQDRATQAAWVTAVFALDPQRPVTSGAHVGELGGGGIVRLGRYDAPDLRFDPASLIAKPDTLHETLVWQRTDHDDKPFAWTKAQTQTIAWVVSCLCQRSPQSKRQPADAVVTTLIHTGTRVEGMTTYGNSGQRYEAGVSIVPEVDDHGRVVHMRYLVDAESGEHAIRVSDAAKVARTLHGALRHGWLDGVFEEYGWERVTLEGHALPGREGRRGPHHRSDVYRGRLPESPDDEGTVTT